MPPSPSDSEAPKPKTRRRPIFRQTQAYDEDRHPMSTYLDGLSVSSRRPMRAALDSIADILSAGKVPAEDLAWHELEPGHTGKLRGRLQDLYAPATGNRYLSALRGLMKAAWRLEYIDRDRMERALDLAPIRGKRELKGRGLEQDELAAVFQACAVDDNRASGARDGAILALLYGGGLRRAEVAVLDLEELDLKRKRLRVLGKGDKERTVHLPSDVLGLLKVWLKHRGTVEPGALFWHVERTGTLRPKRISVELVYQVVLKRHRLAGVERFTPHDLRRSNISDLLDAGVDLATVAKHAGHANVQTTAGYDRRSDRAQEEAAQRLRLPKNL